MMRKLIQCVLIFIILSLSNAFAVNDVYYFPYDSCFNINLEHEQDGTATGAYNQQYSDSDMVGLLGVANVSGKQVFSFEFTGSSDGDPWVYKSVSDPTLKIPFGLDMVVRYNDDKTAGVVHLGYNNNTNNLPEDIIELSRDEEGLVSGFTVTPGNDWNNMWIDIVIVIPLDKRNNFKYGSADDYQAQFNLKVVNSSNYPSVFVTMTGYYGNYNISNSGFRDKSPDLPNFFTSISKGYGWFDKSSSICSFISFRKSMKVLSEFIFSLTTILFPNMPIIRFVSFIFLFAIGLPSVMSSCPVYLYSSIKNIAIKNIYGDTPNFFAYFSIFLKYCSSIS